MKTYDKLVTEKFPNAHSCDWFYPIKEVVEEARKDSSIEFAEWLSGLGYQQYDGPDRWISQEESGNKVFTTKELYQRFLLNPKI